ncbi:flagellar hook-associated protein FlgK [Aeribacillus alveayuensis]|uniref:Flagellar hook-associated protein 1 n=1 Tax=Aeribacillus alveayuensis TaxID=279215 RepID=A0ABT9VLS3_9BACI|nr:flagellar hook-associated protein 1 FlgK [Bacillus alveayuensis]
MSSTFFGIEIAKRALSTQQSALYTTGHNIANANTPGYTRQRVNFDQSNPYPSASRIRPEIPGQFGTGVSAGSVQRIREGFLDVQFRHETSKLGYWSSRADALEKMEEIMNEPSESGLAITLDRFWQSLQDLALNPTNAGARAVVRERGIAVAETFNYLSNSLTEIQNDLKNELEVNIKEINSLLNQINDINKQIGEIEPHGYLPNDLYDERDRLLDELSSFVNIKVTPVGSGGNALEIAEGKATVELLDDKGRSLGTVVDGKKLKVNELSVNYSAINGLVQEISIGTKDIKVSNFNSSGSFLGMIHSFGYTYTTASGTVVEKGIYPEMLQRLDALAYDFAKEFNNIHRNGWSIEDIENNNRTPEDFFDFSGLMPPSDANKKGAAALIKVSEAIKDNYDHIAAAQSQNMGDGSNAVALAEVKNKTFVINGNFTTVQNYYESLIGGMAVDAQEANRLSSNSQTLADAVEERRKSVSSVSLDEEMTNMIQFQHAYNAAARMITLQDEILDRIINNMGLVGR